VAAVLVLSGGTALFRPALQSSLPHLAREPAMLPAANALLDTTERIARLLGPGLVGLTAALLPLPHLVTLDGLSLLISAAAVAAIARLRPLGFEKRPPESGLKAVLRGFAAIRAHPLLAYNLRASAVISGVWSAAYFLALPLMINASAPGGAGLAAYGGVITAYGSANLLGTLVVGNRPMPRRPARLIFAGNCLGGFGVLLLGATALAVPPEWRMAAFSGAAALGALGGPMQDIAVATLRQTELPRADIAAAVRASIVVGNVGLLATLALAPSVFHAIGPAPALLLGGVAYAGAGVIGLLRF
jgi:hypothetical protein